MIKKSVLQNIPVGLILVCLTANAAFAQQTTAFSYQGKLTDAGSPANANYDLQFKLFDTVTVGTGAQQGATLVRNPVAVSAGLFTVQLDFGANVFNGADRYLEIGVRPTGNPDLYTVLAPRQPITASPYAIQTLNAQQLGGLPASGFVQNTTAQQAGANFNIGGTGTAGNLNVNSAVSVAGSSPPAPAPGGQGRLYFDAATNKVKVSENGAPFVNLVGANGVSGSGTTNSIPVWSAGTTLGNSQITQSAAGVQLPKDVQLAANLQGNQVQFGSPNSEIGMTLSGVSGRADLRFDGTLKLLNGPGGSPPATNGIAITTLGDVGIGITVPGSKLHVLSSTGGISAIRGENATGPGVYGKSTSSRGVFGESDSFIGVWGKSTTSRGVFGESVSDVGVSGFSSTGTGVYGETAVSSLTAGGVYGKGTGSASIGVIGESNVGAAVGVFGVSTSPTGVGVYARNFFGGRAIFANGNVAQDLGSGGVVKAMLEVSEFGIIFHCYNGINNTNSGDCGITITEPLGHVGVYRIDFGVAVSERFFSITNHYGFGGTPGNNSGANYRVFGSTAVEVFTFRAGDIDDTFPRPFMIIMY